MTCFPGPSISEPSGLNAIPSGQKKTRWEHAFFTQSLVPQPEKNHLDFGRYPSRIPWECLPRSIRKRPCKSRACGSVRLGSNQSITESVGIKIQWEHVRIRNLMGGSWSPIGPEGAAEHCEHFAIAPPDAILEVWWWRSHVFDVSILHPWKWNQKVTISFPLQFLECFGCDLRPNGKFLSTTAGRYLIGKEVAALMGIPINRLDLTATSEHVSW